VTQRACLIILWKGALPEERLRSLRQLVVTGCHVHFVSDHRVDFDAPNFFLHVLPQRLVFEQIGATVDLTHAAGYKLVDFKIFIWDCMASITTQYECWGFADIDVIYNGSIGERIHAAVDASSQSAKALIFGDRGHFMMFSRCAGQAMLAHIQQHGHLPYLRRALSASRAHLLDEFRFGHKIFALMHQQGDVIWHRDHFQPLVDISYWSRQPTDTRKGPITALYIQQGVVYATVAGHTVCPVYVHIQKRSVNSRKGLQADQAMGHFHLMRSGGLAISDAPAAFRTSWCADGLYRLRMIVSRLKAKMFTEIL
jgi:hypothetical protein